MKRHWPLGIVYYEKGMLRWMDDLDPEEIHKIKQLWIGRGKRRSHKRERQQGKRQEIE